MITAERARQLLDYNAETGWLTWRVAPSRRVKVGDRAGTKEQRMPGYFIRRICVDNRTYYEHRIIWLIVNGSFPESQIDHINHDATDNRLENLREVTHSENSKNQKLRVDNKTGIAGVSWSKKDKRFVAGIIADKKCVRLGSFKSLEVAASARKAAEEQYGFHPNHGKRLKT